VLKLPELKQLDQRVSLRCELTHLSEADTQRYIEHRIATVSDGKRAPRFSKQALRLIHRYSDGTPRLINLIADRCLTAGLVAQSRSIDRKIVKSAVENLELRKPRPASFWIILTATAVAILVV